MQPGEIYWVVLPPSDGREQTGQRPRPALVIQDDGFAVDSDLVLIVPVTGQLHNLRWPGALRVEPSQANGLLKPSILLVHQTRALDRRRFRDRAGVLSPQDLAAVYDSLDRLTGRPLPPAPPTPAGAAP